MIEIYICDDNETARKQIREEIEKKLLIEDYDMRVVFDGGEPRSFLETVRNASQKRNVYFLDVELHDTKYDGFLLGKEIRMLDPRGMLVYITSFQNLAYRTFQYHLEAFDYIVKGGGGQRESIDRCLEALHLRLKQEAQKDVDEIYSVKVGDTFKNVPVQDILFFETSQKGHHVILHTECSRMDFVGNLNEIEGQMGERFIRTHRSYLVAVEKITEIDLKHNKVKAGKQECLVSRKMKSALMERVKM
ncbi:MAG: LytTR family DNA-binding domain-containing protein [Lachnospiraceae bacterium]|nr:LytTR family DNA-binding domain-containing protein [Lachnospiraceae bacterium]